MPRVSNIKRRYHSRLNGNKLASNKDKELLKNDMKNLADEMATIISPLSLKDGEMIKFIHNDIHYNIRLSILQNKYYEYRIQRWNTKPSIIKMKTPEREQLINSNNNNPIWVEQFWYYPPNMNNIDIQYYYKYIYMLNPLKETRV